MAIEPNGSTGLSVAANHIYLHDGSGVGPALKQFGRPITTAELAPWTPIGAETTSWGYRVAFRDASNDTYSFWAAGPHGNYLSSTRTLPPTSPLLKLLEYSFGRDLNGDGAIGFRLPASGASSAVGMLNTASGSSSTAFAGSAGVSVAFGAANIAPSSNSDFGASPDTPMVVEGGDLSVAIAAGSSATILGPFSGRITFASNSGTLQVDQSSSFSGTVAGMTGQDIIDLADINFAKVQQPSYSGTAAGGTLTVTDGTHTANIALLGNYLASTFVAASDSYGGTSVVDTVLAASTQPTLTPAQQT
jgi:hypothetical protein